MSGLFGQFQRVKNIGADILCLLGDIGNPYKKTTRDFLQFCSKEWKQVYWVIGEMENTSINLGSQQECIEHIEEQIRAICPNNCKLMKNSVEGVGNCIILGTSLWNADKEYKFLHLPAGHHTPKRLMPWEMKNLAEYNRRWITGNMEELSEHFPTNKIIFLSYSQPEINLVDSLNPTMWLYGIGNNNQIIDHRTCHNYGNRFGQLRII